MESPVVRIYILVKSGYPQNGLHIMATPEPCLVDACYNGTNLAQNVCLGCPLQTHAK